MRVDPTVAVIVAASAVGAALALSLIPLLAPWKGRLTQALRRGGRGMTDAGAMRRLRAGLVMAQLALSVALAFGCGLTVRSALHLVRSDLGVETRDVVRARLAPPMRTYRNADALNGFYDRLLAAMNAQGRMRVALSSFPALIEPANVTIESEGRASGAHVAGQLAVSPGYFSTLGVRVVRGRDFTGADRSTSEPVAVVSETLARRLWPATDALGQRIRTAEDPGGPGAIGGWRTVVGVVSDVRQSYTDETLSDLSVPLFQTASRFVSAYSRTDAPPAAWLTSLRAVVGQIDPQVLVGAANPLAVDARQQLAGPRFLASVLSGFAILAAVLAVLGNYAVVAYAVQQREREIAIRTALGATRRTLTSMFLREAFVIVGAGLACGALGAFAMGRVLRTQLHGVAPWDPATVLVGGVAVGLTAMAFVWGPAHRAGATSRLDVLKEG